VNHRHLLAAALFVGIAFPVSAQSVKSGIEAWQRQDYADAVKIWRPLAESGDPDAQFNLAQAYRLGRGMPTNLAAAQTWLERSAQQGNVDAETTLGLLLFQSGNRAAGLRWLKAAAEQNDPPAMLVYGTALFNGDTVTQNSSLGFAYVSRAATQGLVAAKDTQAQMDKLLTPAERKKALTLIAAAKGATKKTARKAPVEKPAPKIAAKTSPEEAAAPAKAPAKTAAAPVRHVAAPAAVAAPRSGAWRIQLGAFSQRSSAEALFRKVSGSSALGGRSAVYTSVGAITRLQVGPFESRAAAVSACHALAARGQACLPVPAK
jgi:cell division septation protein DedD